ncbi:ATP-binding response regulator [Glaciecola petra]|uniref:histidine kinase n=1 Tax=Glaciecola petra TaxID=3075602 RepID=A0ABU2ZVP0_9ALTE|nr:hybrid sensor histidine kinase/response regulator [Aestuariibacter sp. P117]MDT0596364.1 hybrid sensor histidine kinase/response regulator [Aestuariibacter sp. P117]
MEEAIDDNMREQIHAEQIKLMHSSIPVLLFINLIIGMAISYGFSDIVPFYTIVLCLGLLVTMVLVRALFFLHYKNKFRSQNLRPFKLSIIVGSAFAGAIWGTIGILYFPLENQTYQFFLLMSLFAMTGGSAFTYSLYLPGYFAYVPSILLPITIQFFLFGDKLHNTLGIVSAVFLIVLTAFNIKINKNFKTSLGLRFENNLLVEQLKEQKEEAERADKAKSKFLAAASHDLRQPLYSLSLFTSVLDESAKDPKTRKIVDQINLSVDALKSLFDALLDISKLDAGAVEAKPIIFPVQAMFDKLANAFDLQAAEKNLFIKWPISTYSVKSEPDLLEQILRNYLENAIRYTDSGEITVKCVVKDDNLTISISDTGIGIPPEELQDIYIEFHQLNNTHRDRKKGLGLGLAIVDRTAKLLGHTIDVESEVGIGSTFSINIQHIKSNSDSQKPALNMSVNSEAESSLLIAIVDDEESIREGMSQLLKIWNCGVIVAASGEELFAQLELVKRKPDMLITDFRLANEMTGADVITMLNTKFDESIPVLIITGDTDQKRLEKMNTGKWQVLHKPVPAAKLRAFIRSIQSNV